VKKVAVVVAALISLSVPTSATTWADEPLGPPVVTTTFSLGVGPMPDVASDPSTNRA
jgi:hypothetical protein